MSARDRRNPAALAQGVAAGDRLALARAMTLAENEQPGAHAMLSALFPRTGRARIIGVTGAPGTGKSTLVTALAKAYRNAGLSVGIAAVDPSSPFTGGALLGDRVRMRALSGDDGVFMRSMATRGSLGGLAKATNEIVMLLDAAGFERIIVETVGVGQAEVEIARTAHTTLVVEAPGLGDEVQAIKAGILEIADILVVNKADRPGADRTIRALELMLELGADGPRYAGHHGIIRYPAGQESPLPGHEWQVDVLKTTAVNGAGVEALCGHIEAHWAWLEESGELAVRGRQRIAYVLESIIRAELTRRVAAAMPQTDVDRVIDAIYAHETDPYQAAAKLLSPENASR